VNDGRARTTGGAGDRGRRGRPRRELIVGAAALLVVVALVIAVVTRDGADEPSVTATPSGDAEPSDLLVLAVTGAPHALLAVIGTGGGRPAAAIVLPPRTTIVVPGQGETAVDDVADLPGPSVQVAVSNTLGAWAAHYAVTDLASLTAAIDRSGGLALDLPEAVTLGDVVLGPGEVTLSGDQVGALLRVPGDDAGVRWAQVFETVLRRGVLAPEDLDETTDAEGVIAALAEAADASVELAPVAPVAATALVLAQPEFDELVRQLYALPEPLRVLVQNGSGEPGVGEEVARRLLPNGFRVVLSQNAESFDHEETQIIATDERFSDDAQRVRELLGTGTVALSQVPSGLADITIVVGKDFTA